MVRTRFPEYSIYEMSLILGVQVTNRSTFLFSVDGYNPVHCQQPVWPLKIGVNYLVLSLVLCTMCTQSRTSCKLHVPGLQVVGRHHPCHKWRLEVRKAWLVALSGTSNSFLNRLSVPHHLSPVKGCNEHQMGLPT